MVKKKVSKFTEEQFKFIRHRGPESVILTATAGSGKTSSATGRLLWLLKRGVKPEKIIFFSFTNDAVNELRDRIKNQKVEITTIHSFCASILAQNKKFKKLASFPHFVQWFKKKYQPHKKTPWQEAQKFNRAFEKLSTKPDYYQTRITQYKLFYAMDLPCFVPDFFFQYCKYLKETRTRDFSDMLIEVAWMTDQRRWETYYEYKYDYVFVDEYQDTSAIQMKILLALRAKLYHVIGDRNQSIYGFSGASCDMIETLLKQKKTTVEYPLSKNFRSDKSIVSNSNQYSDLKAIPHHKAKGTVDNTLLEMDDLVEMIKKKNVAILVRTNKVIRNLEKRFMQKKLPMRYFNFIKPDEFEQIRNKEKISTDLNRRLKHVLPLFKCSDDFIKFYDKGQRTNSFVTTIHKAKGREFPTVVVVNSVSPEILELNNMEVDVKTFKKISFDIEDPDDHESKNIHYVAVTRPMNELYYMLIEEDE